jgi:predicted dehydrogenase
METVRKVGLGIVGAGQRATAFVKNAAAVPGAELVCVCERDGKRLQDFARSHPVGSARLTTSLDELLADDRVEGVVITVPDRAHREVAERCFAAGKHCMIEKPMALTEADCKAIIRAKEKAGRILQVGFVLRYAPYFRKIKEIVDSGVLGQIMSIAASEYLRVGHSISYMRRWHRKKENSGSFMLAKCSHDLDMLNWLVGSRPVRVASFGDCNFFLPKKRPATHCSVCAEAESCPYKFGRQDDGFVVLSDEQKADLSKYDIDICVYNDDKDIVDNQVSILEFGNAVRATFSLQCFYPYPSERFLTITGSKGFLFGTFQKNLIEIHHSETKQKETIDISADLIAGDGHGGGDSLFFREFVACIREGREPTADLSAGLASTVIAEAIEEARMTRRVVEIPAACYQSE